MNNQGIFSGVSKSTTWFIVGSQALMMIWALGSSILKAGALSASIITYLCFVAFIIYAIVRNSRLIYLLLVFGLMGGILELWADHYSVAGIHALIYPKNEPMIISSPLYMPFAWANVFVQLGYYCLLLIRWKGVLTSSIIMAIAGGLYIPFYENFAKDAGWWWYQHVSMIWNAPYYIIICEALISLLLPVCIYLIASKRNYVLAIVLGILEGLWIMGSAVLAYAIAP